MKQKVLQRNFYLQSTLKVAQNLLGKILVRKLENGKILKGKITETEAYLQNDKACHTSRGITPRNKIMFGSAGYAYVYFIYGMYYCLNAVTQKPGVGEAVLIRAVESLQFSKEKTSGPGKLCKAFKISKKLNGVDLTKKGKLFILDSEKKVKIRRATRIGIKENTEKMWRFYINK